MDKDNQAMTNSHEASQIRWGSGTRSDSLEAKSRLLDAAMACYRRVGINRTSIADIATEAKVTRPTVYRYFSSHHNILRTVVRREVDKFWGRLQKELQYIDSFSDYIVEGLVYTLKHVEQSKEHQFLVSPEILPHLYDLLLSDRDYLIDLTDTVRPIYQRLKKHNDIRQDLDILMVCEWFNRLAVSYLTMPSPFYRTEEQLRELFRVMVSPVLEPKKTQI
jgi:AcrR family transcriptional regulator